MKITASKLFDTELVTKALQAAKVTGLEDFITNLSDISDQVIRALKNKISLQDNIDSTEKVLTLKDGVALTLANPIEGRKVRHMIATRVMNQSYPVYGLTWEYTGTGEIKVTAYYGGPTLVNGTRSNTVTLLMFY